MAALIDVIASPLANRTKVIDRNRVKVIQNRCRNMTRGICDVTSGVIECGCCRIFQSPRPILGVLVSS